MDRLTKAPIELQRIDRIIRHGRTRYVWIHCVFSWGVLTAVLFTAFMSIAGGWSLRGTLLALILFPSMGYPLGLCTWRKIQKKYALLLSRYDGDAAA